MRGPEKIRIGEYDCWVLPDGEFTYPGCTVLPPEGNPPEQIAVPYTALLVDTGSVRVLIDTGAGALGPNTGKLPESLAAAGFSPEDIHIVVLSHAHPDHIADLQRLSDATIILMRKEFEFWTAAETEAKLQAGEMYGLGRAGAVDGGLGARSSGAGEGPPAASRSAHGSSRRDIDVSRARPHARARRRPDFVREATTALRWRRHCQSGAVRTSGLGMCL